MSVASGTEATPSWWFKRQSLHEGRNRAAFRVFSASGGLNPSAPSSQPRFSERPTDPTLNDFLTNSDFKPIAPKPSILQSMSWSPSTILMLRTLVPTLITVDDPFTLRSLITVTVSPSWSGCPTESLIIFFSSLLLGVSEGSPDGLPAADSFENSWAHSGHTHSVRSS